MSIYAQFDGKHYKLPDALTLGRGEPFAITDRTLARAHARLVQKKGVWKIKDLHSDCGIMVNGQKIKPGKFVTVNPGDSVLLGNVSLTLSTDAPDEGFVEVENYTARDLTDYSPYIYGGLFILALIVALTGSQGDHLDDVLFLAVSAAFLKLTSVVTQVLRTVYFPMKVVLETNLTDTGVTFHVTGKRNFSLKFTDVTSWHIVGKCFFISAYNKDLIFLLNEGHEKLTESLREKCPRARSLAEPVLERLALLPIFFVLLSWGILFSNPDRFFQFVGHGFGLLGITGLLIFFFSEHLRELLPIPRSVPGKKIALSLGTIAAVTLVMQFGRLQQSVKLSRVRTEIVQCEYKKNCVEVNFSALRNKSLNEDETYRLSLHCKAGNLTACPEKERTPASK